MSERAPGFGITYFTVPRAFAGEDAVVQTNALTSWARNTGASPSEIVLAGDAPGTTEAAAAIGARHLSGIAVNDHGTPLLDGVFRDVQAGASTPLCCYLNADILLDPDFSSAAQFLWQHHEAPFIAFGRRTEVEIAGPLDFAAAEGAEFNRLARTGRPAARVCKDYFLFPTGAFAEIPPFAVGRGNWDNWMVASARRRALPVIDLSPCVTVLHQNAQARASHAGGRRAAYLTGVEARENQRLAGGRNLVAGVAASHRLIPAGEEYRLRPVRFPPFWADLPAFLGLTAGLFWSR